MARPLVKIDLHRVQVALAQALPNTQAKKEILQGLGAKAMHVWKTLAQKELRSTSRDYVAGLDHEVDEKRAVITLEGKLPNMVEQGFDGGDMRAWLLKSPKAKQGANGPYLAVPFRHGTPGTSGRNVGAEMPGDIHAAAKKLAATMSRPGEHISGQKGASVKYGPRLHPGLPMRENARKMLETKKQPWHHSSIYLGMIRKGKHIAGGKVQTTGFTTFRTISQHSNDPQKHWIHPGIRGRHLAKKVQQKMEKLAVDIVKAGIQ
jgi:hypothetical protein